MYFFKVISLFIYLFTCLFISLFIYLFIYLSIFSFYFFYLFFLKYFIYLFIYIRGKFSKKNKTKKHIHTRKQKIQNNDQKNIQKHKKTRNNQIKPKNQSKTKPWGTCLSHGFPFFFVFLLIFGCPAQELFFMLFFAYSFRSMSRMWAEFWLLRVLCCDVFFLNFGLWVDFLVLLRTLHDSTRPFHAFSFTFHDSPPHHPFFFVFSKSTGF